MTITIKVPNWFWIISVLALIWNLMGVMAYLGQAFMPPEVLEAMPEAQRVAMENRPAWATAAFALAVFGGALGSFFLLFKKAPALQLFYLSFFSIIVQMYYAFVLIDSLEMLGTINAIMSSIVIVFGFLLILFAKKAKKEGWIK